MPSDANQWWRRPIRVHSALIHSRLGRGQRCGRPPAQAPSRDAPAASSAESQASHSSPAAAGVDSTDAGAPTAPEYAADGP